MDSEQNLPKPELPKPVESRGEGLGANKGFEKFGSYSPELKVQPMPGERVAQANNAVSQAITSVGAPPINQPIGGATASDDDSQTPSMADDVDVIEKEWVDKAKTIVARTQGDPYKKSTELTHLKKDYMQKRYGKIIKVPEDQSLSA